MRDDAARGFPRLMLPTAWLFMISGAAKVVGLPIFVWPLRDQGAFLVSGSSSLELSPAWLARAAGFVVDGLPGFVGFWILFGLFMIVAAAGLLRQRPWARFGLEVASWLGVIEAVLVAVFIGSVRRMLLRADLTQGQTLADSLVSRFWVSVVWLAVYLILLVLLKRATEPAPATHPCPQGARGAGERSVP